MQKPVLVSVPVPVVSTVPSNVAWSFELHLYLELTVPQVRDCCPLGGLVPVFRLCYVLQFIAGIVEAFCRYMPISRRFLWGKKYIYIFFHILVGFYPSKSDRDVSPLFFTICKRQFSVSRQILFN